MKRALPIIAMLALSGCATTRYVQIGCLSPAQYETLKAQLPPKIHDKLTGKADEDERVIAGSNIRLRGYAEGLLQILEGCAVK